MFPFWLLFFIYIELHENLGRRMRIPVSITLSTLLSTRLQQPDPTVGREETGSNKHSQE
jgi:hypothetical protein